MRRWPAWFGSNKGPWGSLFLGFRSIGFVLTVFPQFGLFVVGGVLFGLSIVGQLVRWRSIQTTWTFSLAGLVFGMWLIRIVDYDHHGAGPNVIMAISIVAVEIIVLLVAEALWEPRAEAASLTPPSGDS